MAIQCKKSCCRSAHLCGDGADAVVVGLEPGDGRELGERGRRHGRQPVVAHVQVLQAGQALQRRVLQLEEEEVK